MKKLISKDLFFYSIGCSFTWGHGLPFYRYATKNGWSNKERDLKKTWWASNVYMQPYPDYWMTVDDYVYQFENRYSGLLAKKLKCQYSSKMENAGLNSINFEYLNDVLHRHQQTIHDEKKLDFIILQLTMPERDRDNFPVIGTFKRGGVHITEPTPRHTLEEVIDWTISEVFKLNTRCKENNIELFVWSWPYEFNILSTEDFWVPIIEKDEICNSLEDLVYEGKDPSWEGNLPKKEYSIPLDAHPNLKCHKIICDSIYTKIKERGIA